MFDKPWTGVLPATLCPFNDDDSIDESGLRAYVRYLASVDGITGLVCNGHTGEVMSLRNHERAHVTEIIADEVGRKVKVVSGVCAEGSDEAIAQARAAKDVGADAILLMPPHHWLRFGRTSETAVGFFEDVAQDAGIDIIVHQYPAWTKAGYSLAEMQAMAQLDRVVSIKMGTREMSRWAYDYRNLKSSAPDVSIISCLDEYLLVTLLDGADGALVGFAGFVPELITALVKAALSGDLEQANMLQDKVRPLSQIVYRFGEPSSDAHQRMKCAMTLLGKFPSMRMRRPIRPLPQREIDRIAAELTEAGFAVLERNVS
ncbi:MAG: dihydrodipicolinate synthase family protein [Chloroflexota bacterium]|nr:dihydrodipicolinate synthase family protein [Chloroflexota bacterium]